MSSKIWPNTKAKYLQKVCPEDLNAIVERVFLKYLPERRSSGRLDIPRQIKYLLYYEAKLNFFQTRGSKLLVKMTTQVRSRSTLAGKYEKLEIFEVTNGRGNLKIFFNWPMGALHFEATGIFRNSDSSSFKIWLGTKFTVTLGEIWIRKSIYRAWH